MAASYITMVRAELSDVEVPEALLPDGSFVSVDCAFVPVDSIADEELAALLRDGDAAGFFEQLPSIVTFPGFEPTDVRTLEVDLEDLDRETLRELIGSALRSSTVDGAVDVWSARLAVTDSLGSLVDQVLDTDLLVEQSKPKQETLEQTAMKVAGKVGVAAAGATAVVIKASAVTGVALAIAGPAGVVIVGVAATLIVYRLLTRRR